MCACLDTSGGIADGAAAPLRHPLASLAGAETGTHQLNEHGHENPKASGASPLTRLAKRPLLLPSCGIFSCFRAIVYGSFGARAMVCGDTLPSFSPSRQMSKSPATSSRISLPEPSSILPSTSLPQMSLSINRYSPLE